VEDTIWGKGGLVRDSTRQPEHSSAVLHEWKRTYEHERRSEKVQESPCLPQLHFFVTDRKQRAPCKSNDQADLVKLSTHYARHKFDSLTQRKHSDYPIATISVLACSDSTMCNEGSDALLAYAPSNPLEFSPAPSRPVDDLNEFHSVTLISSVNSKAYMSLSDAEGSTSWTNESAYFFRHKPL
jgi:hypothetical protein